MGAIYSTALQLLALRTINDSDISPLVEGPGTAQTTLALSQSSSNFNILVTNDDGWAVANIRAQFDALESSGFNVILSAPATDQSGTGILDAPAQTVGSGGCEFDSCPPGSPAEGFNTSNPRLNYVNSFPVTCVKFGMNSLAPAFFEASPDFVVSGPNVGSNTGIDAFGSGTIGAACAAAKAGIASVALSGASGEHVSFTNLANSSDPDTITAKVYAALGVKLTQALLSTTRPFLPSGISLNVNFPAIDPSTNTCTAPDDVQFVLTRMFPAIPIITPDDVETCGSKRLPEESEVIAMTGCFASVSAMDAALLVDASATNQAVVLAKLGDLLTCVSSPY